MNAVHDRPRVLFVGEPRPEHVEPVYQRGGTVVRLLEPSQRSRSDGEVIEARFDRLNEVRDAVLKAHRALPFHGCVGRYESNVTVSAFVAEELGLPGPGAAASLRARDKVELRRALDAAGVPQPRWRPIVTAADLADARRELGPVFVLKPASGSHSQLVSRVEPGDDLDVIYERHHRALSLSRVKSLRPVHSEGPRMLAEELLDGPQVTTTTLVRDGEASHLAVVDVRRAASAGARTFQLAARTTPSRLNAADQDRAREVASAAVRALGLQTCAAHPELIATRQGPKVIEVAPRVGGFRAELTEASLGIDLHSAALALALGEEPDVVAGRSCAATAVEVWVDRVVQVRVLDVEPHLARLATQHRGRVERLKLSFPRGGVYQPPPDGAKPLASFLAVASSPDDSDALGSACEAALARMLAASSAS